MPELFFKRVQRAGPLGFFLVFSFIFGLLYDKFKEKNVRFGLVICGHDFDKLRHDIQWPFFYAFQLKYIYIYII